MELLYQINSFQTYLTRSVTQSSMNPNILFIADEIDGIKIINAFDIKNLTIISSIETNQTKAITQSHNNPNIIFVADYTAGIKIINITDINNPMIISSLKTYAAYFVT